MNRRTFLQALMAAGVSTAAYDVEKLLWIPGAKKIFLPAVTAEPLQAPFLICPEAWTSVTIGDFRRYKEAMDMHDDADRYGTEDGESPGVAIHNGVLCPGEKKIAVALPDWARYGDRRILT